MISAYIKIETVCEVDIIRCVDPSMDLSPYSSRECQYTELRMESV